MIPSDMRALFRNDLAAFIEASFGELTPQGRYAQSKHIEVMASKLMECANGTCRRLIINLPPRSLKSLTASVALPAWILGWNPSKQIICASYGQELADKHARDTRSLMQTSFYRQIFPRTAIAPNRQLVSDFNTTAGGFRMATSVGGVLTGRGADVLIIDDPLKPEDALSESRRKACNEWFTGTAISRLNNKEEGVIIIVMQRLHQDDLVGFVRDSGEAWEVVTFPAIAEADEILSYLTPWGLRVYRRNKGEVLDPSRESLNTLETIRESMGEYNFSAQYQQAPEPVGGTMIKSGWLRYYEPDAVPRNFSHTFQSWDTANKSGELNDYSVCTTWGYLDQRLYLLDVERQRVNFPELKKLALELARQFHPKTILIEDKASGTQLIQDLKYMGLYQVKPYAAPPATDKVMRLHSVSAEFEAGRIFLPTTAAWLADYKKELLTFPGVKFDDQVDSTTQAIDYSRVFRKSDMWERFARAW